MLQEIDVKYKYLDWFNNEVEKVGFQGSDMCITGIVQAEMYLLISQKYCREDFCDDKRLDVVVT